MPNQSYFEGHTISAAMFAATKGVHIGGKVKESFDLAAQISSGQCLLVGEGNLSFAKSLLSFQNISPSKIVATTFEHLNSLSEETTANAKYLSEKGVVVLNGVNARKLNAAIGSNKFSTIVFQFPHTGRRHPVKGKNPNYVLVRDFLNSARGHLIQNGLVCISAVDSPHYQGAFQFEKAAASAGYYPPLIYPFAPKRFKGYTHTMTHEDGSALGGHRSFKTWVFKPK